MIEKKKTTIIRKQKALPIVEEYKPPTLVEGEARTLKTEQAAEKAPKPPPKSAVKSPSPSHFNDAYNKASPAVIKAAGDGKQVIGMVLTITALLLAWGAISGNLPSMLAAFFDKGDLIANTNTNTQIA